MAKMLKMIDVTENSVIIYCYPDVTHHPAAGELEWTPVGTCIREMRKRAGLSLKSLANAIGVDLALISRIENGHQQPSNQFLVLMLRALNVRHISFLTDASRL